MMLRCLLYLCVLFFLVATRCWSQATGHKLIIDPDSQNMSYARKLLNKSIKWVDCGNGETGRLLYRNDSLILEVPHTLNGCPLLGSVDYFNMYIRFRGECRIVKIPNLFTLEGGHLSLRIDKPVYRGFRMVFYAPRYLGKHDYTFWYRDPRGLVNTVSPAFSRPCLED